MRLGSPRRRVPSAAAPGFSPLRLLVDGAVVRFDEFRAPLPAEPDDDP